MWHQDDTKGFATTSQILIHFWWHFSLFMFSLSTEVERTKNREESGSLDGYNSCQQVKHAKLSYILTYFRHNKKRYPESHCMGSHQWGGGGGGGGRGLNFCVPRYPTLKKLQRIMNVWSPQFSLKTYRCTTMATQDFYDAAIVSRRGIATAMADS